MLLLLLLLARVESRTYKAEAAALTETLQRLRPFAFLADFPQASDFREAETSCFQQVGFEGGPEALKFEKKKNRLKAKEINVRKRV